MKKHLTSEGGFDEAAWRAWQVRWFTTGLLALKQRLGSIVVMTRLFKIELPELPQVQRIMAACEQLDAFAHSAPPCKPAHRRPEMSGESLATAESPRAD